MAKPAKLLFTGRSWPATSLERAATFHHGMAYPGPLGRVTSFTLVARGKGKVWSTEAPEAFWRSFSELSFSGVDDRPISQFIGRWGDPYGQLNADGRPTRTDDWIGLVGDLRQIAAAWGQEDRAGNSRCTAKLIPEATHRWREIIFPRVGENLETIPDPHGGAGLVVRAKNLAAFMAASSASALERRVPMRRCQYCSTWFELLRPDARFCSPSCRALSHKQRNTKNR